MDHSESNSYPTTERPTSMLSFQSTQPLYPTQEAPQRRPPRWIPFLLAPWFVTMVIIFVLIYAVGIQVLFHLAQRNNGLPIGPIKSLSTAQFLDGFLPVLLIFPAVWTWTNMDFYIRQLQPYIDISRGNAKADSTVLLDYISMSRPMMFLKSLAYGHITVTVSLIMTLLLMFFQPLAAGLFVVRPTDFLLPPTVVLSTNLIAIHPEINTLNTFVAAAGFVEAAVVHKLPDPPFIQGGWSVANFALPGDWIRNGTIRANTTAVRSNAGCQLAESVDVSGTPGQDYGLLGRWNGCEANVTVESRAAARTNVLFNVSLVDECGAVNGVVPADEFKPVVFWLFNYDSLKGSMIFCSPKITLHHVWGRVDIASRNLVNVSIIENKPFTAPTNVTGPPQNGLARNGLAFNLTNTDRFVEARAVSTVTAVPNAIVRAARDTLGGIEGALDNPQGLLNVTQRIYTQYLAITAKSNYFLDQQIEVPAEIRGWVPRLWVNRFPAYVLSGLLALIALTSIPLHVWHYKSRRLLYLVGPPGTIGGAVSLTSHARFGRLLNATDTTETMRKKLRRMRFGFDPRTSQIIVDGDLDAPASADPLQPTFIGSAPPTQETFNIPGQRQSFVGSLHTSFPPTPRDYMNEGQKESQAPLLGHSYK